MLFTPISIAGMSLKNRIVMPSMGTVLADENGAVTEKMIAWYAERARGGAGLIIVEGGFVTDERFVCRLGIHHDQLITGLGELAQAVKDEGAKAAIQLNHNGRLLRKFLPHGGHHDEKGPDFLSEDQIEQLVESYGLAALRAREAGFDAVEISACHGYLVAQFLSPYTNHRKDRYGGSREKRLTFSLEVVARIRKYTGGEFPIIYRISADEYVVGGLKVEDSIWISKRMAAEGVAALHVSAGICKESFHWANPPMAFPQGCLVPLSEAVKKEVDIPVITVGRINDPQFAESVIRDGKADLVAIGRGLIADPAWPLKASEGRFDDIRKCIYCNYCNGQRTFRRKRIRCAINAAAGRELEARIEPAPKPRRILVVGGGPAGMEAARISALRHHQVILCERNSQLGGRPVIGAKPPHKAEISNIVTYLSRQLAVGGVEVKLDTPVTLELVARLKPDAIVVATGSVPIFPEIPGIEQKMVYSADAVLQGVSLPKGHYVILGGGTVGCETAEFLAAAGQKITIVEILKELAANMESIGRGVLLERLARNGIGMRTAAKIVRIENKNVVIETARGQETMAVDGVVLAVGSRPDAMLFESLKSAGHEVHLIGDARESRSIAEAISEGWQVGRSI